MLCFGSWVRIACVGLQGGRRMGSKYVFIGMLEDVGVFDLCYKICLSGKDSQHHNSHSDTFQMNGIQMEEVSKLKEELEEWKNKHDLLQGQLREKDSVTEKLVSTVSAELEAASSDCFQCHLP